MDANIRYARGFVIRDRFGQILVGTVGETPLEAKANWMRELRLYSPQPDDSVEFLEIQWCLYSAGRGLACVRCAIYALAEHVPRLPRVDEGPTI